MTIKFNGFYYEQGAYIALKFFTDGAVIAGFFEKSLGVFHKENGEYELLDSYNLVSKLNKRDAYYIGYYKERKDDITIILTNKVKGDSVQLSGRIIYDKSSIFNGGFIVNSSRSIALSSGQQVNSFAFTWVKYP